MRTYGYHHVSLPLGNTQWQGTYDFLTDHENYGVNGNNNGNYSYGYVSGGYGGRNTKTYCPFSFIPACWIRPLHVRVEIDLYCRAA